MIKDSVLQNIFEQPKVFEELVSKYVNEGDIKKNLWPIKQRKFTNIIITGMGTSYFSGYPAYLYLQAHGIPNVQWVDASELLHYFMESIGDDTLLILVSQSGESYEIVKILEGIRNAKLTPVIIGLTMTDRDSYLKRYATISLPLATTEETTLGAFKSFTTSIILLLIIAHFLADADTGFDQIRQEIMHLKNSVIKEIDHWKKYFQNTTNLDHSAINFIARGPALCAALGAALITTELAKINSIAFSGGQFRHGPIEMAFSHTNQYIVLAPDGKTQDICVHLARDLSDYKEKIVLLTSDNSIKENEYLKIIRMPVIEEYLAPVLYSIPLQLFACNLAIHRGIEPGTAKIISKVTTFE